MNPLMIAQGVSAATGLIASAIPDKQYIEKKINNTEGSSNAGRVSGAIGVEESTTLETKTKTPEIKKALLGISGVTGTASSIMSMTGMKGPEMNNSLIGLKGQVSGLMKSLFSKENYLPSVNPLKDESLVDDIPANILNIAKTTVEENPWKLYPSYNKNKGI